MSVREGSRHPRGARIQPTFEDRGGTLRVSSQPWCRPARSAQTHARPCHEEKARETRRGSSWPVHRQLGSLGPIRILPRIERHTLLPRPPAPDGSVASPRRRSVNTTTRGRNAHPQVIVFSRSAVTADTVNDLASPAWSGGATGLVRQPAQ